MIVEDSILKVLGITKKGKRIDGIPANLKYYKTDFVGREDDFLVDKLLDHIKEMIQLEHGVSVDGKSYILVMSDDEADQLEAHWSDCPDVKGIYISRNVLLTTQQNALFNKVNMETIPDYYFNFEMKDVGESW